MSIVNITQFIETLSNGEPLEPPYGNDDVTIGTEDGFTTDQKCIAVQIIPEVAIRVTTDGKPPNAFSRYIAANQLATFIFQSPNQWHIKTRVA